MPDEVRAGEKVDLLFPGPTMSDIILQSAAIFIMKIDQIKPYLYHENSLASWTATPQSLMDFADCIRQDRSRVEVVAQQLATTVLLQEGQEIDPALIHQIVRAMYARPPFSLAFRSALVHIGEARPLVREWADGLREAVRAREIHTELWNYAWRDFVMLPDAIQAELQDVIWDAEPSIGCLASIVSAFSYQNE
jgi:hypothetical protein